ncbi:MAG TPA: FAD-linked oxidase C-terminal domain-containing protein [Candidatus Eremiobacteraceae bacterium]
MDAALLERLSGLVGARNALMSAGDLRSYGYDASIERAVPELVLLPNSAEQVAAIVSACCAASVPFVARGAGTGLSGGAIAESGGVVIATARLNRILEIDTRDLIAVVEPGVVNAALSAAVALHGLRFVPDPSSMAACTVGGNVAENSGGLHCLAYGVTSQHVLGVEIVTAEGEIVWLGGKTRESYGYDLLGAFIGSEGTCGIATKICVRLVPIPAGSKTMLCVFDDVDGASHAVSDIIASGIVPGALEMMDATATAAIEAFVHAGFPLDAAAILMVEADGGPETADEIAAAVSDVCTRNGAREVRVAPDAEAAARIWKGRKSAFGAMGRLSPNYYVQDGVIPRSRLPDILREVAAIGVRNGVRIANVFHAGDGNLHPLILFDDRIEGDLDRTMKSGAEILEACVRAGGSITGEHGVGMEKRDCMSLQFSAADLNLMALVRSAFDERGLCNPGKLFPTARRCGESARHVDRGEVDPSAVRAAGEAF